MQLEWLTQQGHAGCILFFAGWAMGPEPFSQIPARSHDVLMVFDYRVLEPVAIGGLRDRYETVHLLAWSMGVWVAGSLQAADQDLFATATAINGTLKPIDDRYGIAEQDYGATLHGFTAATPASFYASMFESVDQQNLFSDNLPCRGTDELRDELAALRRHYSSRGPAPDIYTRKLVGSRDRIFPARNQIRAWGREQCTLIQAPHFPFYDVADLGGLIRDAAQ